MAIDYDTSKPEESAEKIYDDLIHLPPEIKTHLNVLLRDSPIIRSTLPDIELMKPHIPSREFTKLTDLLEGGD